MIVFGRIFVSKPILVRFFALFQCRTGLLRSFQVFLGTFDRNCGKSLSEPIQVVKKGHLDERVFGDFSKTSYPIGIILVP